MTGMSAAAQDSALGKALVNAEVLESDFLSVDVIEPDPATVTASTVPNDERSKHKEIVLTDQTNLLPPRIVIPVFAGLSLCALISCLDATIVATALPTISNSFHAGAVISWVPSAYLLTSTVFQPICQYTRYVSSFGVG